MDNEFEKQRRVLRSFATEDPRPVTARNVLPMANYDPRMNVSDVVESPAWKRICQIKDELVGTYRTTVPGGLDGVLAYMIGAVVRDVLDEFLGRILMEAATQINRTTEGEQ